MFPNISRTKYFVTENTLSKSLFTQNMCAKNICTHFFDSPKPFFECNIFMGWKIMMHFAKKMNDLRMSKKNASYFWERKKGLFFFLCIFNWSYLFHGRTSNGKLNKRPNYIMQKGLWSLKPFLFTHAQTEDGIKRTLVCYSWMFGMVGNESFFCFQVQGWKGHLRLE